MRKNRLNEINLNLYNPGVDGLTHREVSELTKNGFVNKTKKVYGKSYWEIFATNIFSFFNILLFIIAGFMIFAGHYGGLLFLAVLIPNIIIGLYEDIKARHLMGKLRLLTDPKAIVIREGKEEEIKVKDVVLFDVLKVKSSMQISADAEIIDGSILVNESMLTGESDNVTKVKGDTIYSGSYVVSGVALARATHVGKDSYIETLQNKANKFKRSPSEILRSLKRLFTVIGVIVIALAATMVITYAIQKRFINVDHVKEEIKYISGSMVAMIPSGLYLLTSLALATSVIALGRKKAQVQDFYSVEMLARTNCLCVDKTGTITDGTMTVKKVDILNTNIPLDDVKQMVANLILATQDTNLTALALKEYFTYSQTLKTKEILPFNSDNKYSAATFVGGETYVLGAGEFLNLVNKSGVLKRVETYTREGYRVLILGSCKDGIVNGKVKEKISPVALIILQDHVKESAIKTFRWFKENGVAIKVISGDNAVTVAEIARQAGVENADNYISLENMPLEQVKLIAASYTVFGRVSPEQKEVIVQTLKEEEHKVVAMTGDGVNDILALKRADCSIAMASGSDAARNISHIVLLDNDFDHLPDVVAEGRRVINNLQRTSTLFLTKTCFAMFFTVIFLVATIVTGDITVHYPFSTNNFYLWELVAIGLASFFVALEPNKEQIKGSFMSNISKKLIPSAIAIIVPVLLVYILYVLQINGVFYSGISPDIAEDGYTILSSSDIARSMSSIMISVMSFVVLFKVCFPFSKWRLIVFSCCAFIGTCVLVGLGLYTRFTNNTNILEISFDMLSSQNYLTILLVLGIVIALYFGVTRIIDICRGSHLDD